MDELLHHVEDLVELRGLLGELVEALPGDPEGGHGQGEGHHQHRHHLRRLTVIVTPADLASGLTRQLSQGAASLLRPGLPDTDLPSSDSCFSMASSWARDKNVNAVVVVVDDDYQI